MIVHEYRGGGCQPAGKAARARICAITKKTLCSARTPGTALNHFQCDLETRDGRAERGGSGSSSQCHVHPAAPIPLLHGQVLCTTGGLNFGGG